MGGYTASGELRNNTDDLSIKFLEGSNNNPAFPPYQSGHQAQSQAPQAAGYPTMYSKKCMSMPAEATNGGSKTNEVRNITRSFSLIMAAFENDSLGAGPSPMMSNGNAAAQYPQKNQYPEMQYQQQQMYSNKYNEGQLQPVVRHVPAFARAPAAAARPTAPAKYSAKACRRAPVQPEKQGGHASEEAEERGVRPRHDDTTGGRRIQKDDAL